MKRRILSSLMALVLCLTLLPAVAYADGGTAVYVSSTGDDTAGDGSQSAPYATLAKAVDAAAADGATIYVMSDLTMTECARFRPVAIAKKIVVLTKLTLAGKPALCYNFPVASAGFYRSCKYDPYPVESGERLSSKSANIPEPHRIPLNPGPGRDSKEIAWKEGINL